MKKLSEIERAEQVRDNDLMLVASGNIGFSTTAKDFMSTMSQRMAKSSSDVVCACPGIIDTKSSPKWFFNGKDISSSSYTFDWNELNEKYGGWVTVRGFGSGTSSTCIRLDFKKYYQISFVDLSTASREDVFFNGIAMKDFFNFSRTLYAKPGDYLFFNFSQHKHLRAFPILPHKTCEGDPS